METEEDLYLKVGHLWIFTFNLENYTWERTPGSVITHSLVLVAVVPWRLLDCLGRVIQQGRTDGCCLENGVATEMEPEGGSDLSPRPERRLE